MFNFGKSPFQIKAEDRIAQLVVEKFCTPEVAESETLSPTIRGDNGFGSSGV